MEQSIVGGHGKHIMALTCNGTFSVYMCGVSHTNRGSSVCLSLILFSTVLHRRLWQQRVESVWGRQKKRVVKMITEQQPSFIFQTIKNKTAIFSAGNQSVANLTERIFLAGRAASSSVMFAYLTACALHVNYWLFLLCSCRSNHTATISNMHIRQSPAAPVVLSVTLNVYYLFYSCLTRSPFERESNQTLNLQ